MTLRSIAAQLLPPILVPKAWSSPFEAANWSSRRGSVPGASPTDARQELTSSVRTELVRKSRYLHKNSGFVRELVANMAIYSTGDGIRIQAQSGDAGWNRAAEEYFSFWSARCEVTRRFSFEECQALVCRGIDIDGEYFVHKTRDTEGEPRLQLIESHRIGDEFGSKDTIDGVGLDGWGAPVFYRVLEDNGKGRDLPAPSVLHLFEPEWAGGVRSHPTIQHSINHVLDEMELLALEKHAVKDNCDVARVLKTGRGEIDDNGDFVVGGTGGAGEGSDPVSLQRIIGGKLVALKPEESLDSFQPNRPSPTFTGFLEHLRRDSALGVIPFEFAADSGKIGGAGVRLIVAKADRRFSFRQMILERRLLRPVWAFVIGDAIDRGLIDPVAGWWKISSTPPKRVVVDSGREAQQNRADVEMGLKTLSDHYGELGADFGEEVERRAADARLILETAEKFDVPVEMLWKPGGRSVTQ
ncbi:phage portal protein [Haloferula sp. A504]|uniref:phage portal protein n=1 Tax=Haloferula sp. A504 TaxID=3373601 RepID=UPI0031BFF602|nr:phage portal protein [Verrucomicrobiaceae bacterium E54]